MKTLEIIGLSLFIFLNSFNFCFSQDSLSTEVLKPISYTFNLEDGKLAGAGAEYLLEKVSKAQFTLLGEFHGSKNISEFTEALIPHLTELDYRHMVLEVGPNSGQFLDKLPKNKKAVISELKKLNQKYLLKGDDEFDCPIPFFNTIEDAKFLGEAKESGWKILGIDQEYVNGFSMQLDWMFDNLDSRKKAKFQIHHSTIQDTLQKWYNEWDNKHIAPYSAILQSEIIQDYLSEMAKEPKNFSLVDGIRKSCEIYHMNTIGKWYNSNDTRVQYMKERLRLGLDASNFDISKNKLLIKMGGYHMSQGFSPLGFYEVGNTLNEIAEYHGNSALNIGFINRYEMNENGLEDALEDNNKYIENNKSFYGMGSKDEWIIIDLVSLREGFYYYPAKYQLNMYEEKIIQRFDVLIVTPTEFSGTDNF